MSKICQRSIKKLDRVLRVQGDLLQDITLGNTYYELYHPLIFSLNGTNHNFHCFSPCRIQIIQHFPNITFILSVSQKEKIVVDDYFKLLLPFATVPFKQIRRRVFLFLKNDQSRAQSSENETASLEMRLRSVTLSRTFTANQRMRSVSIP